MSQYPSNFGQQPGGQSPGGPSHGGPGGSPYSGAPQQPAPKKGTNWFLIIGAIVGVFVIGGAGLGVCCCGGGWAAIGGAMQMNADAVAASLRDNAVVQEHIGDIASIKMNWEESAAASEGGPQRFAFDVTGSKGSGLLVVESNNNFENMEIYSGELILPSGEQYDLNISGSSDIAFPESFDAEMSDSGEVAP